jgi:hypothetical protein
MATRKDSANSKAGDTAELTFQQVLDVLNASVRAYGANCRITLEIEPTAPEGRNVGEEEKMSEVTPIIPPDLLFLAA